MQNMENYMQRLAELVLTGMGSEVLSCCISSTAICVEVRHPAPGWGEGKGANGQWVIVYELPRVPHLHGGHLFFEGLSLGDRSCFVQIFSPLLHLVSFLYLG